MHRTPECRELRLTRHPPLDVQGALDRRARLRKDQQEGIPDPIDDPAVESRGRLAHDLGQPLHDPGGHGIAHDLGQRGVTRKVEEGDGQAQLGGHVTLSRASPIPGEMKDHVLSHRLCQTPMMEMADHRFDDRQCVLSHGLAAGDQLAARQARGLESLVDVEVKEANLRLGHALERVRIHPDELQQGGLREAGVEGDLRLLQHPEIVLVHDLVARPRGFA